MVSKALVARQSFAPASPQFIVGSPVGIISIISLILVVVRLLIGGG